MDATPKMSREPSQQESNNAATRRARPGLSRNIGAMGDLIKLAIECKVSTLSLVNSRE
jgi:hypothetical protein